jgi:hypothetical protein
MGHSVTYLGISMTFDGLLSTPRVAKCLGKNKDRDWRKMEIHNYRWYVFKHSI